LGLGCAESIRRTLGLVVVAEDYASGEGDGGACCGVVACVDFEVELSEGREWDNNSVGVVHLRHNIVEVEYTAGGGGACRGCPEVALDDRVHGFEVDQYRFGTVGDTTRPYTATGINNEAPRE
jgi:hypothetical protein